MKTKKGLNIIQRLDADHSQIIGGIIFPPGFGNPAQSKLKIALITIGFIVDLLKILVALKNAVFKKKIFGFRLARVKN